MLGSKFTPLNKKTSHNRGSHLKSRILEAFKQSHVKGIIKLAKYVRCGEENGEDIYLYFDNVFGMKESTTDPQIVSSFHVPSHLFHK